MLMNIHDIVKTNELIRDITGVIHIGAHHGQELETFVDMGVKNFIFFEPLVENYLKLNEHIREQDTEGLNIKTENVALGHREAEMTMYVETVNQSMSCSLLKPKVHLELYPDITFDSEVVVPQTFLDKYVDDNQIDMDMFNFINIDVQGYELEVFKGAMGTLTEIDCIYTEVNTAELYENCVKVDELDEFLGEFYGFERVETIFVRNGTWGDALYVKK